MSNHTKVFYTIVFAAFNAIISSFALFVDGNYSVVKILSIFSFLIFGINCLLESNNLLFLARTFILGIIGYFPMIIKIMFGEGAFFSSYEISTQDFDIVLLMYVTTSFALLSNNIGLAFVNKRNYVHLDAKLVPISQSSKKNRQTRRNYWRLAGLIGVILALFSSYIFIRAYGQTILVAGYGSEDASGAGIPFGSVGVLGAVGIFSLFVAGMKGYIKNWKFVFYIGCFVFIIYSQIFMGPRQDAMSTLFGLLILYGVANRREIKMKVSYIPILVIFYIFFEVWGVAREVLAAGVSITSIIVQSFTNIGATDAVRMGTFSPIATTFSNTVWLIENHIINYSMGQSYLEWILRIPPEILYPGRPADYALMFQEHGLISGGGFFELAEVYMNFGLLGALVIPGIISFLMAKSYYYAFYRQSMLSYFLLFSFLSIFLRGTWYQTFAFFRAFLVCMLLYFVYLFIVQILWPAMKLRIQKRCAHSHQVASTS